MRASFFTWDASKLSACHVGCLGQVMKLACEVGRLHACHTLCSLATQASWVLAIHIAWGELRCLGRAPLLAHEVGKLSARYACCFRQASLLARDSCCLGRAWLQAGALVHKWAKCSARNIFSLGQALMLTLVHYVQGCAFLACAAHAFAASKFKS